MRTLCPAGRIGPIGTVGPVHEPGADSVGYPPGRGLRRRGGRSRSGGCAPLTTNERVNSRVGGPADDTHRNPLAWAGGSPEGPSEVIALVGTGNDKVGSAMSDGPSRAKAGVVIVTLLTREARGSRILARDRARGRGLALDPNAASGHNADHAVGAGHAGSTTSRVSSTGRGGSHVRPALAQLALPLRPGWAPLDACGAVQRGATGRTPTEAGAGRSARDASKEKVLGPRGHTGVRNRRRVRGSVDPLSSPLEGMEPLRGPPPAGSRPDLGLGQPDIVIRPPVTKTRSMDDVYQVPAGPPGGGFARAG